MHFHFELFTSKVTILKVHVVGVAMFVTIVYKLVDRKSDTGKTPDCFRSSWHRMLTKVASAHVCIEFKRRGTSERYSYSTA